MIIMVLVAGVLADPSGRRLRQRPNRRPRCRPLISALLHNGHVRMTHARPAARGINLHASGRNPPELRRRRRRYSVTPPNARGAERCWLQAPTLLALAAAAASILRTEDHDRGADRSPKDRSSGPRSRPHERVNASARPDSNATSDTSRGRQREVSPDKDDVTLWRRVPCAWGCCGTTASSPVTRNRSALSGTGRPWLGYGNATTRNRRQE